MKPGDIIICINDLDWPPGIYKLVPTLPVFGHFYTVRRVIPNFNNPSNPPGIALDQIRGEWRFFLTPNNEFVFEEFCFEMTRFKEPIPPSNYLNQKN